jgi:hypothetical protein
MNKQLLNQIEILPIFDYKTTEGKIYEDDLWYVSLTYYSPTPQLVEMHVLNIDYKPNPRKYFLAESTNRNKWKIIKCQ